MQPRTHTPRRRTALLCVLVALVGACGGVEELGTRPNTSATPATWEAAAPEVTNISAAPGDRTIALSWDTTGSVLIWEVRRDGQRVATVSGTEAPAWTDHGTTNGVEHRYEVLAGDMERWGAPAAVSAYSYTTPGPVAATQVIEDDSTVTLRWAAPVNNGGSTLVGYTVRHGDTAIELDAGTLSHTAVGLTNGVVHSWVVTARNQAGDGAPVELVATPARVADTPTVNASPGARRVMVTWSVAYDGGAPVDGWVVYRDGEPAALVAGNELSWVDTGRGVGVEHRYQVEAHNRMGVSERSGEVAAAAVNPEPSAIPDGERQARLVEIADANAHNFDWRGAGIDIRYGCHWRDPRCANGTFDLDLNIMHVSSKAFAQDEGWLHYVVVHELAHGWQRSTGRLDQLRGDMARFGFAHGLPSLEAGADCLAKIWGASRKHYWTCSPAGEDLMRRRLAGDWN